MRKRDILQDFHDLKEEVLEEVNQTLADATALVQKNEFDKARIKLFAVALMMNKLKEYHDQLTGKGETNEKVSFHV